MAVTACLAVAGCTKGSLEAMNAAIVSTGSRHLQGTDHQINVSPGSVDAVAERQSGVAYVLGPASGCVQGCKLWAGGADLMGGASRDVVDKEETPYVQACM